jgi:hypothetical protein
MHKLCASLFVFVANRYDNILFEHKGTSIKCECDWDWEREIYEYLVGEWGLLNDDQLIFLNKSDFSCAI